MADFKTLACVGLNGFEQARVRLLLEEANTRLPVRWALGLPGHADLLLLVEGSPEAEAVNLTVGGQGLQRVFLREGATAGRDTLPTGFGVDDLVHVLSSAYKPVSDDRSIDTGAPAFSDVNVDEQDEGEVESYAAAIPDFGPPRSLEVVDLEQFMRRDGTHEALESIVPAPMTEATGSESVADRRATARFAWRTEARQPWRTGTPQPVADAPAAQSPAVQVPGPGPGRSMPSRPRMLEHFLGEDALAAPCLLQVEGAEALVLDPRQRVYMIAGDLASVDAYASGQFTDADFDRLTSREIEQWRARSQPQPYLRLQWLLALRRGEGWLPRHLDPGGTYRVRRILDLDEHFDPQIRISEVLRDWHRLHEVARSAGVDMQSVFHCVTAFDAIGWLESRPRERRS